MTTYHLLKTLHLLGVICLFTSLSVILAECSVHRDYRHPGPIQYVNPKFTEVTGYTFQEALGQNPRILKTDLTPPAVYQQMWET